MVILDGLEKLVAYSELNLEEVMKKVREKVEPHGISEIEIELSKEEPLLEISAKLNNCPYYFEYDGYPSANEIIRFILLRISYDNSEDDNYWSEYKTVVNRFVNLSKYDDNNFWSFK